MPLVPQFDDALRARLRELLAWRRDVRRSRREALPESAIERLIARSPGEELMTRKTSAVAAC